MSSLPGEMHVGRCKTFPSLESDNAFYVRLERLAKVEKSTVELDIARITAKRLAMQLKSSRFAEEKEYSAHDDWRNRVETSQNSKRRVLISISEDM